MPRKPHTYHYIYKTTCLVNDNYYIGMHSTSNLDDKYIGSGKRLQYSINKYGYFAHSIEALEFLPDRESLKRREKEIVNIDLLKDPMCMNLVIGGDGGFSMEIPEHREKLLKWAKAGSKANVHRLLNDLEFRKRMSKIISVRTKNAWAHGKFDCIRGHKFWVGKKHKEESKVKIGLANVINQQGKKNSQYGTVWVHKDEKNQKIKKEELEVFLNNGWTKGRVCNDQKKFAWVNQGPWVKKKILISELELYLNNGWNNGLIKVGAGARKPGWVNITNGTLNKNIDPNELNFYEQQGWRKGWTRVGNGKRIKSLT